MFRAVRSAVLASVAVRFSFRHLLLALAILGASAGLTPVPSACAAAMAADSTDAEFRALARTDSLILSSLARMRGVVPGADTMVAWKVFEAHPRRTLVLLMPTLRSIPRGLSLGAPNMVWRVRVAQRLTGLTFRARTKSRLSDEEKKWLAPDGRRAVRGRERGARHDVGGAARRAARHPRAVAALVGRRKPVHAAAREEPLGRRRDVVVLSAPEAGERARE